MEGSTLGYAGLQQGQPSVDRRPFDQISDHANTAGRICDLIEQFIDRCRGGGRLGDGAKNMIAPAPTGHLAQMERLEKNLARAEELTRELGSIG